MLYIDFSLRQIDMKNQTERIQRFDEVAEVALKAFEVNKLTIKLSQNEFTDHDDSFGFLRSSSEPFQFMSIEGLEL